MERNIKTGKQDGFTILELMIVMTIIAILVAIAIPMYQQVLVRSKETVLLDNQRAINEVIDQYTADKGKMPQSVNDLVGAKYLQEVPMDPITEQQEWEEVPGDDPNNDNERGMKDVKSKAEGTDTDGVEFSKY